MIQYYIVDNVRTCILSRFQAIYITPGIDHVCTSSCSERTRCKQLKIVFQIYHPIGSEHKPNVTFKNRRVDGSS